MPTHGYASVILIALLFVSCDFRRPAEGYDPDWQPDHNEETATEQQSVEEMERPGSDDTSLPEASSTQKRPTEIAADTASMERTEGTWEIVGEAPTNFTTYYNNGVPAMIVEREGKLIRSYYFNDGALFYYNEQSGGGAYELTVEFDDIGDVIGARKQLNDERYYVDNDDFSAIVKHAVELQRAAKDQTTVE